MPKYFKRLNHIARSNRNINGIPSPDRGGDNCVKTIMKAVLEGKDEKHNQILELDKYFEYKEDFDDDVFDLLRGKRPIWETMYLPQDKKRIICKNYFVVLKRYNSFTPALPRPLQCKDQSRGGGYFLRWQGKGIAIDPGFNFIQNLDVIGLSIGNIDAIILTHGHNDHYIDIDPILTLIYEHNDLYANRKSGAANYVVGNYEEAIQFFRKGLEINYSDAICKDGILACHHKNAEMIVEIASTFKEECKNYRQRDMSEAEIDEAITKLIRNYEKSTGNIYNEKETDKLVSYLKGDDEKINEKLLATDKFNEINHKLEAEYEILKKFSPKRIDLILGRSGEKTITSITPLKMDQIRNVYLLNPGKSISLNEYHIEIHAIPAKHWDFYGKSHCVGLRFTLSDCSNGKASFQFGITGDTGYYFTSDSIGNLIAPSDIYEEYINCCFLVAHIGSIYEEEFEWLNDHNYKHLYEKHLGILGLIKLACELRSELLKLVIIGEYGEEMKHIRTKLTKVLNTNTAFGGNPVFRSGDIGLVIRLDYNSEFTPSLDILVDKYTDAISYSVVKENVSSGGILYESP